MAAKLRSISDTGFADIENTQQLTLMSQQSLARIFLKVSLSLHPTGMQDDKYIDVFCICHPEDTTFSSANQCYRLEYRSASEIIGFDRHHSTHPIRPSSSSTFWTVRSGRTVTTISSVDQTRQLWHLHNNIHGPFDFASVNGRRTETVLHRRIGSNYTNSSIVSLIMCRRSSSRHVHLHSLHQSSPCTSILRGWSDYRISRIISCGVWWHHVLPRPINPQFISLVRYQTYPPKQS